MQNVYNETNFKLHEKTSNEAAKEVERLVGKLIDEKFEGMHKTN